MAIVLLDTTVASFLFPAKKRTAERRMYEPHLMGNVIAVSAQTVGELLHWADLRNWGTALRQRLDTFIAQLTVLPCDGDVARTWASVMTHSKVIGRRLEAADAWIAATAVHHGLDLITHDKDFVDLKLSGLTVVCYA